MTRISLALLVGPDEVRCIKAMGFMQALGMFEEIEECKAVKARTKRLLLSSVFSFRWPCDGAEGSMRACAGSSRG